MALIHNVSKTLDVMRAVNEGNDQSAASMLGLKLGKKFPGSLLERVCSVAAAVSESHNGGILVTPDEKQISTKSLVSEMFNASTDLSESIAMITTNSAATLSSLSENNAVVDQFMLDENTMDSVKDTFVDGLNTSKDALSEVFNSTVSMVKNTRNIFSSLLENCQKKSYINLLTNAVMGASALCAIDKISEYSENNAAIVNEAMNTYDIRNRADTVMFDTLDLQEALFDLYYGMHKFNKAMVKSFSENNNSICDFISVPLEKIAAPLAENTQSLHSNRLSNLFNKSVASIAALYDEYLQDACSIA